jgi:hypothetical protein
VLHYYYWYTTEVRLAANSVEGIPTVAAVQVCVVVISCFPRFVTA